MKKIILLSIVIFSIIYLVGCSKPTLSIDQNDMTIEAGDTVFVSTTSTDLKGANVNWSTDDTSIISITPSGLVTGLKKGQATIIAKAGDLQDQITIYVTETPHIIKHREVHYDDSTQNMTVVFQITNENDIPLRVQGTAKIIIQNSNLLEVYNQNISFSESDFTYWTKNNQEYLLANIIVPYQYIQNGGKKDGIVSLEVVTSDNRIFSEFNMTTSNIPNNPYKFLYSHMMEIGSRVSNQSEGVGYEYEYVSEDLYYRFIVLESERIFIFVETDELPSFQTVIVFEFTNQLYSAEIIYNTIDGDYGWDETAYIYSSSFNVSFDEDTFGYYYDLRSASEGIAKTMANLGLVVFNMFILDIGLDIIEY
jgi:hypothetical protein